MEKLIFILGFIFVVCISWAEDYTGHAQSTITPGKVEFNGDLKKFDICTPYADILLKPPATGKLEDMNNLSKWEPVPKGQIEVDKFYRALDGSWVHGKTKEKIIPAMTIGGQLQGISKIQGWRFGLPKETKEGQSWYGLDLGYTPKANEPFKYDKSSWSIVNTTSNAKFYNQVPLLYTESPQGNITEAERAGADWTNRGKNLGVDSPAYVAPMVPKEDAEDNESDSEDHSQQLPRQQPQPRRYNAPRSPPPNYCPPGR
jgi:hypothetical protein